MEVAESLGVEETIFSDYACLNSPFTIFPKLKSDPNNLKKKKNYVMNQFINGEINF